jgi:DNA-binding transcriptional ArsR family regulator
VTLQERAQAMLPGVRDEIRQLRQLEAALLQVIDRAPQAEAPEPVVDAAPAPHSVAAVADGITVAWTPAERRAAVLQTLKACGPMRVSRLAAQLDIAQATAQRDVEDLMQAGMVARVDHGTYAFVQIAWCGADRTPLADVEHPALARRPS